MGDYYQILGVSRTSSDEDIKKAYRKKAKQWHPDRHNSASKSAQNHASQRFKEVTEAYEALTHGPRLGARPAARQQPRHRAYTRPQNPFQGSTDWAHVRNRYAYQRPRAETWQDFWSQGLRREQARSAHTRSQMLLLLGTFAAIWAVDSVSTSLWQANNHGRLYKDAERQAKDQVGARRSAAVHTSAAASDAPASKAPRGSPAQAPDARLPPAALLGAMQQVQREALLRAELEHRATQPNAPAVEASAPAAAAPPAEAPGPRPALESAAPRRDAAESAGAVAAVAPRDQSSGVPMASVQRSAGAGHGQEIDSASTSGACAPRSAAAITPAGAGPGVALADTGESASAGGGACSTPAVRQDSNEVSPKG